MCRSYFSELKALDVARSDFDKSAAFEVLEHISIL